MNELEVHGGDASGASGSGGRGASRNLVWTALAVGAFGVIVGITGIVQSNSARKEVDALRADMMSKGDPVDSFRSDLSSLDNRVTKVSEDTARLNNNLRSMQDQVNAALSTLSANIKRNSDALSRSPAPAPAKPAPEVAQGTGSGGPAPAATAAPAASSGGEYTVQPNDSLWKIARANNTTVAALEAANPGIDPQKLQPGQKIKLP